MGSFPEPYFDPVSVVGVLRLRCLRIIAHQPLLLFKNHFVL